MTQQYASLASRRPPRPVPTDGKMPCSMPGARAAGEAAFGGHPSCGRRAGIAQLASWVGRRQGRVVCYWRHVTVFYNLLKEGSCGRVLWRSTCYYSCAFGRVTSASAAAADPGKRDAGSDILASDEPSKAGRSQQVCAESTQGGLLVLNFAAAGATPELQGEQSLYRMITVDNATPNSGGALFQASRPHVARSANSLCCQLLDGRTQRAIGHCCELPAASDSLVPAAAAAMSCTTD